MKFKISIILFWILFWTCEVFGQADGKIIIAPVNSLLLTNSGTACTDLDKDNICDSIDPCVGDVGGIDYDGDGILFTCDPDYGNIGSACKAVGQLCSGSRECCSGVCLDDGSGISKCQAISGCQPYNEFCSNDYDCCSYFAFGVGNCQTSVNPGACVLIEGTIVGRCGQVIGSLPVGELCGQGHSNNCCSAGGSEACFSGEPEDPWVVERCMTNSSTPFICRNTGEICGFDEECCSKNCLLVNEGGGIFAMQCE